MNYIFSLLLLMLMGCDSIVRPTSMSQSLNVSALQEHLLVVNGLALTFNWPENGSISKRNIPYASTPCLSPNQMKRNGDLYYIVCSLSQEILVLDRDLNLMRSILLPDSTNPWDIEFINSDEAYLSSFQQNKIYHININPNPNNSRVMGTIDFPVIDGVYARPQGILVSNGKLYVALANLDENFVARGKGQIAVIDIATESVVAKINLSSGNTSDIYLAPNGQLYAINTGSYDLNAGGYVGDGTIDIIDPATSSILNTLKIGGAPLELVFSVNGKGYLTNGERGELLQIDWINQKVLSSVNLTPSPCGGQSPMSYLSAIAIVRGNLWVAEFNSNCLIKINQDDDKIEQFYKTDDGPDILLSVE